MSTTLTVKGQVTIPKPIRDAMGLTPGTSIDFAVNRNGEVVLHKADSGQASRKARTRRCWVCGSAKTWAMLMNAPASSLKQTHAVLLACASLVNQYLSSSVSKGCGPGPS